MVTVLNVTVDSVSFLLESQKFVRVDSLWMINTAVNLSNTDQNGALLHEELSQPVSDVTETLQNESFSFQSLSDTELFSLNGVGKNLLGAVVNSQTSGLSSSSDTHMRNGLSGSDCGTIDVSVTVNALISIHDNGHLSLACSEIWARDVNAGSNRLLLS